QPNPLPPSVHLVVVYWYTLIPQRTETENLKISLTCNKYIKTITGIKKKQDPASRKTGSCFNKTETKRLNIQLFTLIIYFRTDFGITPAIQSQVNRCICLPCTFGKIRKANQLTILAY